MVTHRSMRIRFTHPTRFGSGLTWFSVRGIAIERRFVYQPSTEKSVGGDSRLA
jgi:hypothetical protein